MKFAKITLGVISIGLLTASLALADGPKVSGSIETTFQNASPATTFPSTFSVDAVHLNLDGSHGKAGYHVGLDFGVNQPAFAINNIHEAYITLRHDENCLLTVGKFVTPEGIEVIDSGMNPTITRGYLFFFAEPFSHTGVKMDHQFGKVSLALGVVNGWDVVTDFDQNKMIMFRVGWNGGDPLTVGLSGYVGPDTTTGLTGLDPKTSIDLTGVSKWGPLAINFQWNKGSQTVVGTPEAEWSGWGLQPVYWVNNTIWVGGRIESFDDEDGGRTGTPSEGTNISIAPGMKISDATTVRAEYRQDKISPAGGGGDVTIDTTSVELIYSF